jgi:hypothetical protein
METENREFVFVWGNGYGISKPKWIRWDEIIIDDSIGITDVSMIDDMKIGQMVDLTDLNGELHIYRIR